MKLHQSYAGVSAYITRDGSEIRELMHPAVHGNRTQSLAEAIVQPGESTLRHVHQLAEELYHILAGRGRMALGTECFEVLPGDTVCIPPGTPHNITALGDAPLRFLCCCAPAYSHADTLLLDGTGPGGTLA